jgi:hypothetical protein
MRSYSFANCSPTASQRFASALSSEPMICKARISSGPSVPVTCGTESPATSQTILTRSFLQTFAHNRRSGGGELCEKNNSASCSDMSQTFANVSGEGSKACAVIAARSLSSEVFIPTKHIPNILYVASRRQTKPHKTIDFHQIPQYGTHRSMMRNVRVTDSSPDGLAARFSRPCDREFFIPNEVASYV